MKKLLQYNLTVFHFIQHYLFNFYSSKIFGCNIKAPSYSEMIAGYNRFGCRSSMKLLNLRHKLLAFFANGGFAFRILEIRRILRLYAPYIICKKLVLDFNHFSCWASSLNRAATSRVVIVVLFVPIKFDFCFNYLLSVSTFEELVKLQETGLVDRHHYL
jgi:hypothetical protein